MEADIRIQINKSVILQVIDEISNINSEMSTAADFYDVMYKGKWYNFNDVITRVVRIAVEMQISEKDIDDDSKMYFEQLLEDMGFNFIYKGGPISSLAEFTRQFYAWLLQLPPRIPKPAAQD